MGIDRPIDIPLEQRKTILALLERHLPNTTAWVYGSRANWSARPQSDLDMVVFAKPEQSGRVSELREAFAESNLPFRVDLFDWNVVPEDFRKQITADYVVLVENEKKEVRKDWKNVTLGDYIEINKDTYSPKDAWQQITYLDTGNISKNRISEIQNLVVGRDKIPTRARRKVRAGDIVYSTVRPNQRHYGLLNKPPENLLVSTGFAVIRGKKGRARTDFIYWFLAQDHIVERLHTIAEHSTSAYPSIRPKDIEALTLNLPPLSEQRTIAQILGKLDDKIELNQRMNKSLEAMAQALFKSWFVNFDPVHAKATLKKNARQHSAVPDYPPVTIRNGTNSPESTREGDDLTQQRTNWTIERARTYLEKMDPTIAALFPDSFIDSQFGKIPKGWETKTLGALAKHHKESISPSSNPSTLFEHHSIPAFDKDAQPTVEFGGSIKSNKTLVPEGAILLSKLNPNISRVWIPNKPCNAAQVASTEFLAYIPRGGAGRGLLFCLFKSPRFRQKLQSMVTGTSKSHQRVPHADLLTQKVLPGTHRVFEKFELMVAPSLKTCLANRTELRNLQNLRDTLLPELISGALGVEDWDSVEATA